MQGGDETKGSADHMCKPSISGLNMLSNEFEGVWAKTKGPRGREGMDGGRELVDPVYLMALALFEDLRYG